MNKVDKCVYSIVPITVEDKLPVIEFLRTFFFRDEPLILGIDMLEDTDSLGKLENYCFNFVNNGELENYISFFFYKILNLKFHSNRFKVKIIILNVYSYIYI